MSCEELIKTPLTKLDDLYLLAVLKTSIGLWTAFLHHGNKGTIMKGIDCYVIQLFHVRNSGTAMFYRCWNGSDWMDTSKINPNQTNFGDVGIGGICEAVRFNTAEEAHAVAAILRNNARLPRASKDHQGGYYIYVRRLVMSMHPMETICVH